MSPHLIIWDTNMIIEINKLNIAMHYRAFVSDAKGNCEVPYTFHIAYDYNIHLFKYVKTCQIFN